MNTDRTKHLLPILASITFAVAMGAGAMACSATTEAPTQGDDLGSEEPEMVSAKAQCSKASYEKAFQSYKTAVDNAKLRARGDVCGDGTMLHDIANDLGNAVTTCGQFKSIIATSKWAAPVRNALKGNLGLAALDGRLQAKDSFQGLAASLAGTTVFGPAPGVYGNMSKITFAAGGAATLSRLDVSDDGTPSWNDTPATYKVQGAEITVTVGAAGSKDVTTTTYRISVESYGQGVYENLPAFLLKPTTAGDDFRSMPSECEA